MMLVVVVVSITNTSILQRSTPYLKRYGLVNLLLLLLKWLIIGTSISGTNSYWCTVAATSENIKPPPSNNDNSSATTTNAVKKTSDDYIVHDLSSIEPSFQYFDGNMYAGLISTTSNMDSTTTTSETTKNDTTPPPDNDNDDDDGALMFWLYEPSHPTYTDTLVIWLNGGPGCSSFGGMMFENGPVTISRYSAGYYGIDPNISLSYNPYSWTQTTSIMYIEQPQGGTGFSQSGTIPHNEYDISRTMYHFLQNFYTIFDRNNDNEYWRSKQLYLFGESYAGMFVPSIAHYIYERNIEIDQHKQQLSNPKNDNESTKHRHRRHISLTGIALGNGWMDVEIQGPSVIDYAWWHGMIDSSTKKAMHHEWQNCRPNLNANPTTVNSVPKKYSSNSPFHTFTVPDECGIMGAVLQAAGMNIVDWGKPNAYDVTTWDPYLMLDIPSGSIHQFFNNPDVQKALHVDPSRPWNECVPGAGRRRRRRRRKLQQHRTATRAEPFLSRQRQLTRLRLPGELLLDHDEPISVIPYVADLLDKAGIQVLIYNGDRDMTTNSQGSELLLDNMVWDGAAGWSNTNEFERGVWLPKVEHQLGGYIKQYRNLEFLVVYNSGHLVPFNQDKIALELVTRFLGNHSFLDKPLPKFHIHRTNSRASVKEDKGQQVNSCFIEPHYIRNIVGASICMFFGSLIGFIFAQRSPKNRKMYQEIPNN